MNGHEQSNIVEDYTNFFKKIEKLKQYIVKFDKDDTMNPKVYPLNCIIEGENK